MNKYKLLDSIVQCQQAYDEDHCKDKYIYVGKKSRSPWYKPWKWINEFLYLKEYVDSTGCVRVVINVRGTRGIGPWIDNCDIWPVRHGFYDGFYDGADILYPELFKILGRLLINNPADHKLVLRGHSRGGAIAEILAWKLSRAGYNVTEVQSWDSPPFATDWGKILYDRELGDITTRIRMKHSLVPNDLTNTFFRHTGRKLITLDNNRDGLVDRFLNHDPKRIIEALKHDKREEF